MVSRLGEGHMPCNFFLSEPQLKTTVIPQYSFCQKFSRADLGQLTFRTSLLSFVIFPQPVATNLWPLVKEKPGSVELQGKQIGET